MKPTSSIDQSPGLGLEAQPWAHFLELVEWDCVFWLHGAILDCLEHVQRQSCCVTDQQLVRHEVRELR